MMNGSKNIRKLIIGFFILTPLFLGTGFARAEERNGDYYTERLENGAVITARYLSESPLVTIQVHVLSGLSNEAKYAGTGISHFLEHLLFKGTKNKTSEELRKEIKSMGAFTNASTGLDSAEYHITVPNENFEKALSLLADIVMEPVFTKKDLEAEREVILKEMRLHNDDPLSKETELAFSESYSANIYKYPIIGEEKLLKKLRSKDIVDYHAAAYRPDRMVIGIAGGVSCDRAVGFAKEKFKKYKKSQKKWPTVLAIEPKQTVPRQKEIPMDVTLGYLAIAFHTTSIFSPELYSGDVLSILLGEGNDSRLYKRLVKEKELLYTVSSANYTPAFPGLLIVTGIGEPEKLDEARKEIFKVIGEIETNGITDREVGGAKKQVLSRYFYSHENIVGLASIMTMSQLLMDSPALLEVYVDEINKVEKENVKRFAREYLTLNNSTAIYLLPEDYYNSKIPTASSDRPKIKAQDKKEQARMEGLLLKERENAIMAMKKSLVIGLKEKKAGSGPGEKSPEKEKMVRLENGLRIIVKERGELPLVTAIFAAAGGLRAEDSKNNGISNLTASLVLRGTTTRSEEEIIPAIERMGGGIDAFSGMNSIGVTMSLMSEDLEKGFDIFEDVIRNSVFPEGELTKEKKKILAVIREEEEEIFDNGMFHLKKLLFKNHPYSMRPFGEMSTVLSISRDQIAAFYKERFAPNSSVMAIVGDIDADQVIESLTKRFGSWAAEGAALPAPKTEPLEKREEKSFIMPREQSLFLMGFQGIRITDKKRYPMSIISSLLSGSDGMLFYTLREKEGLTYSSGAMDVPGLDPGYFVLYVATTEKNVGKTKSLVLELLENLRNGDILDEEIQSSKATLISQQAYSLEANSSMSMVMALDELYGLGFQDYKEYPLGINSVTKGDITDCAKEIIDPDKSVAVTILPD